MEAGRYISMRQQSLVSCWRSWGRKWSRLLSQKMNRK